MGRANLQQKETDEILSRWKSKAEAEEGGSALAICYSRCALLQLKGNQQDKDSPWASHGELRCEKRAQIAASYSKEETRPRATSDNRGVRSKAVTVKLSNIPLDYSRTGLCEKLAEHGFGYAIDFLYLPAAETESTRFWQNKGVAFVNLRTKDAYRDFCLAFDNVASSICLPSVSSSDELVKVSLADTQGRDANYRDVVTASNMRKWAKHEAQQPLFLDDYGQRMPLVLPANGGGYNNGATSDSPPRARSSSDSCQTMKADSPAFIPMEKLKADSCLSESLTGGQLKADSPAFVPSTVSSGSTRASPSLGPADSPVFVPKAASESTAMASPSLRATAKEFVPSSSPALLPAPAMLDADSLEPLE